MKTLLLAIVITVGVQFGSVAQVSSKIMDSYLNVSTGELSVYLTDTLGISGISIAIGTQPDSFNVYSQQFTISGNTFGSNGVISNNVLKTTITGLGNQPDFYTRVRILLDNSQYNEIEIHTEN